MKVAVAQFSPVLGDKQENIKKIIRFLKEAKRQAAEIVVFPELALTGYSIGERLPLMAETREGDSLKTIALYCKSLQIHALISFPEEEEGRYYISSTLIDENGLIVGVYRKTHLFHAETNYFTRGEGWPVFQTKFGKVGAMICYDLEFPEVSRLLRLNGADIILVNTANMVPYEKHQHVYMQSRAMENEVPVVICNRTGKEGELDFFGHSMAVNNEGEILFKLDSEEGIRTIDIQMDEERDPKLAYTSNLHSLVKKRLTHLI
ncbi:carbon-nitrogen hydrolase family protein [Bacillus sp. PK3_68]|uniref:carbon-nitrogen hydrolase family protein n=1 Tax=Bacillus sp. PK3_68 TaxID=2027408 RepID=UPI000E7256B1|nr:carbon-nitrogen hydrolase family protein [Bacillus sp. PK3_68]RJS60799.1 carbon-nitrogen hydrolase family protein [Bacillus sp. PK3_68]